MKGNPATIARGNIVRAELRTVLQSGSASMVDTCRTLGITRTGVLYHLGSMQLAGAVRRYTTQGGVIKVEWA